MGDKMLLEKLHNDSEGYIALASKNPNWEQRHYKNDKLPIALVLDKLNVYVSQNTFYKPYRRLENLKEIKALYIDIDCYAKNLTKEGALYFIEKLYGEIPRPNYIVDSGRGLYYIILLKDTNYFQLPLWQTVEQYLFDKLKHLGADPKCLDATRVLRVEGSINSKTMTTVKILETYNYDYTLAEIQEHYIPEIDEIVTDPYKPKPKTTNKKGRPKKFVSIYNLYNLYYSRIMDIVKICELRDYDLKGHREQILFLYRYFNNVFSGDERESLEKILELNSMFKEPLPNKILIRDTASADKFYKEKKYRYSNEKLIKVLDITMSEQEHLSTIISTEEKYRRNNIRRKKLRRNKEGYTLPEQNKLDNINQVFKLKSEGLNNTEIAKKLGLSRVYVSKIVNLKV